MSKIKKIIDHQKLHGTKQTISWLSNNVKYRFEKLKSKPIEFDLTTIPDNQKDYIVKKTKGNIFIFGTVPYYDIGGGQRSAQLAKIFNKLGYCVHYIFAFDSVESKKFKLDIPCVLHKHISHVTKENISNYINEFDIAIFEGPCKVFKPFIGLFKTKKAKIIYENIDNWESQLGNSVFDADTLKIMLEESDLLTATAEPLIDQLKEYLIRYNIEKKKIIYVPNAVDDELFNPNRIYECPSDLIKGSKTLLYYGSLWGDWFDWDLISELAINNPEISINLIGDNRNVGLNKKMDNIHFLGIKRQSELPAYLAYSDYAILPFKPDVVGKYVSPLKVFEYICMNKPVIATPLPDIIGYPNVQIGSNLKEWQKILNKTKKLDINKANSFISSNNWYSRCFSILENISKKGIKKCISKYYNNISVVVLNYNNANVIFRCIDTLKQNNERYNYEIVVVDNCSTDGSYEDLIRKYSKDKNIKVIQNSKNGCSSGRNLGVENATKDYILFLDSDEWILHKYWLDNYLDIFNNTKNIGAIAWGAGWFNEYGLSYRFVDNYSFRSMPPGIQARCDIGYLATCGFMIEKKLFNNIEGFDEAYDHTYYEGTDLSLAVRNSGKEIYYSSHLGVGHLPHQTTKAGSSDHDKLTLEKGKHFVSKWKKKNSKLLDYKK